MKDRNLSETDYIESDPNPFPTMEILPGIGWVKRLGGVMIRFIYFFPLDAPDNASTHFKGGGPTLDEALDREHSVGHLIMDGTLTSQEGLDWLERLDWVEKATKLHE